MIIALPNRKNNKQPFRLHLLVSWSFWCCGAFSTTRSLLHVSNNRGLGISVPITRLQPSSLLSLLAQQRTPANRHDSLALAARDASNHQQLHHQQNDQVSRRVIVRATLGLSVLLTSVNAASCIADENEVATKTVAAIPAECQNGVLVAESAVPGAYDQICMNLPVRSIPIQSTERRQSQLLQHDNSSNSITLYLEQGGTGAGKTGLAVWNASLLLSRLVQALAQQQPTWLVDKSVVEVGCGAGLVSLVAAHNGATSVWATDGNPAAVELTRRNVQRNPTSGARSSVVKVDALPWGELEVPLDAMGQADVILGSDLTYNSGSWRELAETMVALIKPKTGVILYLSVGHSGFNARGELDGFSSVAQQLGLSIWKTDTTKPLLPSFPLGIVSLDLWLQTLVTPTERAILSATGGAQILALYKK